MQDGHRLAESPWCVHYYTHAHDRTTWAVVAMDKQGCLYEVFHREVTHSNPTWQQRSTVGTSPPWTTNASVVNICRNTFSFI